MPPPCEQGHGWREQVEEKRPSSIGSDVLQPHQQVHGLAFEELRLPHFGGEYELL